MINEKPTAAINPLQINKYDLFTSCKISNEFVSQQVVRKTQKEEK